MLVVVGLGDWRLVPAWRGAASFRDVSANESPIVVRSNEQRYPGAQKCTMKPSRCVCDACRWHKKADTSASASVLQYASFDQARRRSDEPEFVDATRDSFLSTATICCRAAHHCAPVGKTAHWAAHSTVLHAAQHAAFVGKRRARSAHGSLQRVVRELRAHA